MLIERINPTSMRKPDPYYVNAIKTGNLVFVAGQAANLRTGKVVGDITAQAEEVFWQVRECLRAAGTDFENVVKWNTYITQPEDMEKVGAVRKKYMNEAGLYPA